MITFSRLELPGGRIVSLAEIQLACCALETHVFKLGFRQSEASPSEVLLLVSGTLTSALRSEIDCAVVEFLAHLPDLPHRIVAVGACATSGGPYWDSPTVIPGLAEMGIFPDLFIAGCPPSPQAIAAALQTVPQRVLHTLQHTLQHTETA